MCLSEAEMGGESGRADELSFLPLPLTDTHPAPEGDRLAASYGKERQAGPSQVQPMPVKPVGASVQRSPWESEPGQRVRCVFCGGALCRSCSKEALVLCPNPAIQGLHSTWITGDILAMQRPPSRAMEQYGLADKFVAAGIGAIFNCTVAGEHPYCGDGILEKTGMSYDPEAFQSKGIEYYNFGWEDMTAPTVALMQDIVRLAMSVIHRGRKIAVHCHAGFGRTGLVVACLLMIMDGMSAREAVDKVRERRARSVQTKFQEAFVCQFAERVTDLKTVYRAPPLRRISYVEALCNQNFFLHGEKAVERRWVAQPLHLALNALEALATTQPDVVAAALAGVTDEALFPTRWGIEEELLTLDFKEAANRQQWHNWEDLTRVAHVQPEEVDARIPAQLMYDYLASLSQPLILHESCLNEVLALNEAGVLDAVELAQRLTVLSGCHFGVMSTLERVMGLLWALNGRVQEGSLHRAKIRTCIALMQLDKVYGACLLNGRDLIFLPAWATFKTTIRTLRMLDSQVLNKVLRQMDLIDRFMTAMIVGWHLVRRKMVGQTGHGKLNAFLTPLQVDPLSSSRAVGAG